MSGDRRSVANTIITPSARSGDGTPRLRISSFDSIRTRPLESGPRQGPPQVAAHGAHRGYGEPGLRASAASCRDANGSNTKLGAARPLIVEERGHCSSSPSATGSCSKTWPQQHNTNDAARHPVVTTRAMSARCVPLPAPHLRMSWTRSRETGQLPRC
jgi:hypothetical protein